MDQGDSNDAANTFLNVRPKSVCLSHLFDNTKIEDKKK